MIKSELFIPLISNSCFGVIPIVSDELDVEADLNNILKSVIEEEVFLVLERFLQSMLLNRSRS